MLYDLGSFVTVSRKTKATTAEGVLEKFIGEWFVLQKSAKPWNKRVKIGLSIVLQKMQKPWNTPEPGGSDRVFVERNKKLLKPWNTGNN